MVLLRGRDWAFSLESPARWRRMRQSPEAVPWVGWWAGSSPRLPGARLCGFYLYPLAVRWIRRPPRPRTDTQPPAS